MRSVVARRIPPMGLYSIVGSISGVFRRGAARGVAGLGAGGQMGAKNALY